MADPKREHPQALEFWIFRFLDARIAAEAASASTLKAYRYSLQALANFLRKQGIDRWEQASSVLLEAFLREMAARQGWSPRTWNQKAAALRAFFHFLEAEGVIRENPTLTLPWRKPGHRIHLSLPADQRGRLLAIAHALPETPLGLRDRLIVDLISQLGLRAGQAVALTIDDVDLAHRRLRIHTRGGPYWVEIPGLAAHSLQRYLRVGRPALLRDPQIRALLLNVQGNPLTRQGLWRAIKVLAVRAGLPPSICPERLRQPPGLPLVIVDPEGR